MCDAYELPNPRAPSHTDRLNACRRSAPDDQREESSSCATVSRARGENRAAMKAGSVLLWLSAVCMLLTLRSVNVAGGPGVLQIAMCLGCFALAMAGAASSAGPLVALGEERDAHWCVFCLSEYGADQVLTLNSNFKLNLSICY